MAVLRVVVSSGIVDGSATASIAMSIIPGIVLVVIVPVVIVWSIGVVIRVVCIPITIVAVVRLRPVFVIAWSPVSR